MIHRNELSQYMLTGFTSRLIPLHVWDATDQFERERGKSPADNGWRTTAYTSSQIEAAITGGQNLGIRLTENDLVIDLDPRNMTEEMDDAIATLEMEFGGEIANAPTVNTGSGGRHIYLCIPNGLDGDKTRNEIPGYPGVEFKTVGRQVVSAGSRHPNGEFYAWDPACLPLAERPEVTSELLAAIKRPALQSSDATVGEVSPDDLRALLDVLDPEEFREHDKWLELMMACHAATAGAGGPEFVAWSVSDEAYAGDAEITRDRWESLTAGAQGGVTAATLYLRVREAGGIELLRDRPEDVFAVVEIPEDAERVPMFERNAAGRPKPTVENALEAIDCMGISPEYDELHDRVTLRGDLGPIKDFFPAASAVWDDRLLHAARTYILRRWRLELAIRMLHEAIYAFALRRPFNPIHEYLDTLRWDGTKRLRSWLIQYAGAEPSGYTQAVSRMVVLSAVARALKPGIKYDTMIVFEGRQGCGKSSMLKVLGREWHLEGIPHKNPNDKDVIQAMQGFWIIEMEELAAMRRSDVDSLKAFLTRTSDRARFAYAQSTRDYPRRTVFIGTTNDAEYLVDATGNRRFLPVAVGIIDLTGLAEIRDQLFAEALEDWRQDPTPGALVIDKSLWERASEIQESRRIVDPIEERLFGYLAKLEEIDFISTECLVFEALQRNASDMKQPDFNRVSTVMAGNLEWRRTRRRFEGAMKRGYERVGVSDFE